MNIHFSNKYIESNTNTNEVILSVLASEPISFDDLSGSLDGRWESLAAQAARSDIDDDLTEIRMYVPICQRNSKLDLGYAVVSLYKNPTESLISTVNLFAQDARDFYSKKIEGYVLFRHQMAPNGKKTAEEAFRSDTTRRLRSTSTGAVVPDLVPPLNTFSLGNYDIPTKYQVMLWSAGLLLYSAVLLIAISTFSLTFDSVGYGAGDALARFNLFDKIFGTNWSDIDVKWAEGGKHAEKFACSLLATAACVPVLYFGYKGAKIAVADEMVDKHNVSPHA